jgi:hypothetical protein
MIIVKHRSLVLDQREPGACRRQRQPPETFLCHWLKSRPWRGCGWRGGVLYSVMHRWASQEKGRRSRVADYLGCHYAPALAGRGLVTALSQQIRTR